MYTKSLKVGRCYIMADFKDIVKQLRLEHDYSQLQLAQRLNVSKSTVAMWETGKRYPSNSVYEELANFFQVDIDYLYGRTEYKTRKEMLQHFDNKADLDELRKQIADAGTVVDLSDEIYTPIKVLGEVAAGIPMYAQEDVIDFEYIPEKWTKSAKYFGLKIKGDSMSPRISEGDTVIVRQQGDAESGDIVIVRINGDTATCKRLMKYADRISLHSFNPAYKPKDFTNEQIAELPVEIIGKVIENRQKY